MRITSRRQMAYRFHTMDFPSQDHPGIRPNQTASEMMRHSSILVERRRRSLLRLTEGLNFSEALRRRLDTDAAFLANSLARIIARRLDSKVSKSY